MPDPFSPLFAAPAPTAERPLSGVTVLVVEDSRFASEAVRLLCLRSGARIRRADSLRTAERHLATYRPTVVLVDVGLPDGSGIDLIMRLAGASPRLPAILATSGDHGAKERALRVGADAFLPKPIVNLAEFQNAILTALHMDSGARSPSSEPIAPDPLAYRDDLVLISECFEDDAAPAEVAYAAQFLAGVAHSAQDGALADAAISLRRQVASGAPTAAHIARVAGLVEERLNDGETRRLA
jgi:CheY-like chemotaxis protein